jgi:hypothetical protein
MDNASDCISEAKLALNSDRVTETHKLKGATGLAGSGGGG